MAKGSATAELTLPTDVAVCHGMIRELLASNQQWQRRYQQLEHRLDQLLKRLYGPRADKINPLQPSLFPELNPEPPPPPPTSEPIVVTKTVRPSHGRRVLPANLRRETTIVDIPEAEKRAIGGSWELIGEESSEKLDCIPGQLFVRRTVRRKYVVRFDDKPDELKIAGMPPDAMPKSLAAPGLVADVIVSKCVDHMPLYRQEKRYWRQGMALSRSTLCGWLAEAGHVLTPLYLLLKARVLSAKVVHTDDTPIPVQDPDRDHCRTGRIWAYVSVGGVVYDATEDRCRDGPLNFLQDFRGYLQCDAYAGYDELFRTRPHVVEVGCWAHARRKFVEAEKTDAALAHEAVARIQQLYAVEHEAKQLDPAARLKLRQQKSQPLLDALKAWLDHQHTQVVPRTPSADAIIYARNQWSALTTYITDGDLAIDNNAAERAIKPFAIGRKNWLFFGSDRGGQILATLASFTATCEVLTINPWEWLRDTLTQLPLTPADQLHTLLPTAKN